MLSFLHIENVALIKQLDIDFKEGFTAMTGETASGKSMIIDSINFLLGQRPKKDAIRNGEEYAYVYALFSDLSDGTISALAEYGVEPDDDGTILVSRRFSSDGKSVSKINSRTVQVSLIKNISSYLISINEQHDSFSLLNEEVHIDYLDKFASLCVDGYQNAVEEYSNAYSVYNEAKNKLNFLLNSASDRDKKLDFLKYQKNEIENAKIKIGEEQQLLSDKELIKNSELISNAVKGSLTLLSGGLKPGAYDKVVSASDNIEKIKDIVTDGDEIYNKLIFLSSELQDVIKKISTIDTGIYDDPTSALDGIEERLELISKIENKYGDTEEDVLNFYEQISNEISELEQYDFTLAEVTATLEKAKETVLNLGKKLRAEREEAGKKLSLLINSEFQFLDMDKVFFEVFFEPLTEYSKKGLDKVSFYVQTNPGEPKKKLSDIASGGELSRIMLSLKKVLSSCDEVGCIVFDEIDTGVSGKTSSKIGLNLKKLAKMRQVICVTHSAQVSAIADNHIKISKIETDGRMFTNIKQLDKKERVKEIARILGGVTITDSVLKSAEELIEQGINIKD